MQFSRLNTAAAFLEHEFEKRRKKNPAYSLRAFSRDLGLSPSRLSEVLQKNAGVSEQRGRLIADRLKLRTRGREYWLDLVRSESSRSPRVRELARQRLDFFREDEKIRFVGDDQMQIIADWFHGALMELPALSTFQNSPQWMAEELGITVAQVEMALERLQRLGLIRRDERGGIHPQPEAYQTLSDVPSVAVRKYHRQILDKAIQSVLQDSVQVREINSTILAIPLELLPELKGELQKFMNSFYEKTAHGNKDALYALSLQLFPVTKSGKARAP